MASCKLLAVCFAATFSMILADVANRELTVTLYPDCQADPVCRERRDSNKTDGFPNVAYVRAPGTSTNSGDVLHYILTTVEVPSLLMVQTAGGADAMLSVNWTRLLRADNITDIAGSITASKGTVVYSFATVFTRLFEYDDKNDDADMSMIKNLGDFHVRNFTDFSWMNVTTGQDGRSVIFNTTSLQPEPRDKKNKTGSISFEFELNNNDGRDDDLPRLKYNANNTQMNFALDSFVPWFNNSRFALEVALVSQKSSDAMFVQETKSIDDENSPGVFRLVNWYAENQHRGSGGYLQYKPVCYLEKERSRSAGTEVSVNKHLGDQSNVRDLGLLVRASAARAYFGDAPTVTSATNISFGLSEDGFYVKNNFTAWTASMGIGKPPTEGISTMVIIVIIAGLGIPAVLIVFGGVFMFVRKMRQRQGYARMDNVVGSGVYGEIN